MEKRAKLDLKIPGIKFMRTRTKGKFHQIQCREGTVSTGTALLFLYMGAECQLHVPGHITQGKDPVSHLQEAG